MVWADANCCDCCRFRLANVTGRPRIGTLPKPRHPRNQTVPVSVSHQLQLVGKKTTDDYSRPAFSRRLSFVPMAGLAKAGKRPRARPPAKSSRNHALVHFTRTAPALARQKFREKTSAHLLTVTTGDPYQSGSGPRVFYYARHLVWQWSFVS